MKRWLSKVDDAVFSPPHKFETVLGFVMAEVHSMTRKNQEVDEEELSVSRLLELWGKLSPEERSRVMEHLEEFERQVDE